MWLVRKLLSHQGNRLRKNIPGLTNGGVMTTLTGGIRFLSACVIAATIGAASRAAAVDTGKTLPPKDPPSIVNCGDPATSRTCYECGTGGQSACCYDPLNCVVMDTSSSAIYHYSIRNSRGLPSFASYLAPR